MITTDELKVQLAEHAKAVKDLEEALAIEASRKRVQELEHTMSRPGFYDDAELSKKVFDEVGDLKGKLNRFEKLQGLYDDAETMLEMLDEEYDPAMIPEAEEAVNTATNAEVAGNCDLIFLAVKPQMMEAMLEPLRFILAERTKRFVLCTMAAGLPVARIQEMAGGDYPVIRIMPNTPASVGEGMIQYCSANVTAEEEAAFCRLMAPAGRLDAVAEGMIDAASCVSGCGPAWVYQFIEALADGGVACGLPRAKAQEYAAQMVLGSAKLVLESGKHPGALKDAVCSPGGSTIQGVRVLEEHGLRGAVMDAVLAAYDKTKEMGKG